MNTPASNSNNGYLMYIYLGEREFSTIPNDVPIEKWLYDKAWMRSYCSRAATAKRKVGNVLGFFSKKLPVSPAILLAIALVAGAVYLQKIVNSPTQSPVAMAASEPKTYPIKPMKTESQPVAKVAPPAETVDAPVNTSGNAATEALPIRTDVIEDKVQLVIARTPDEVEPKKKEKAEKQIAETKKAAPAKTSVTTEKKQTLQESMAKTNLPVPARPTADAQPRLLPPLPQFIAPAKSQAPERVIASQEKKVEQSGKQKSWMAIEDSVEEPKQVTTSNVAAESNVRQEESKTKAPVKPAEPISEAAPVVLQNYKIVTLTKNSVVIADPTTKAHKQIFVGAKMPGGETVKAVNEDAGTVTTDVRVLKMK